MKKALLAVIGAGVVASMASLAFADDDAAYSANAVGVVKYTIPANGGLACITLPLHPMETSDADPDTWVFGETGLPDQLDIGSVVYFWTGTGWASSKKDLVGGRVRWTSSGLTRTIKPGEAIFVRSSPTNQEDKVISLLGELPTEDELDYTISGSNNLDTRSVVMYPVEVPAFGTTTLASNLPVNSVVYFWTGTGWAASKKDLVGGKIRWSSSGATRSLGVGEGVFVRGVGDGFSVTNSRPFDW